MVQTQIMAELVRIDVFNTAVKDPGSGGAPADLPDARVGTTASF